MNNAKSTLNKYADEQGWNPASQLALLLNFIDSAKQVKQLDQFLSDYAAEENEL